jgi:hypothetical protein
MLYDPAYKWKRVVNHVDVAIEKLLCCLRIRNLVRIEELIRGQFGAIQKEEGVCDMFQ